MLRQQCTAGFDATEETFKHLSLLHPLGEAADDGFPGGVVDAAGDTAIHQDFHIAFGFGDEDQHAGIGLGVVQIEFDELPPRQIAGAPAAPNAESVGWSR